MSIVDNALFPLGFDLDKAAQAAFAASQPAPAFFAFPSPPASNSGLSESFVPAALDFDIDAFTNPSPENLWIDDSFDFGPAADIYSGAESNSSPTSTALISPKSSFSYASEVPLPSASSDINDAAEALSSHHLQRYLHYKAVAAQAEADAHAAALAAFQPSADLDNSFDVNAFLSGLSMPTESAPKDNNLTAQSQLFTAQPTLTIASQPQATASMAHAQAFAHLQAHDAASRLVNRQTYIQPSATRSSFEVPSAVSPIQHQLWSRRSSSGSVSPLQVLNMTSTSASPAVAPVAPSSHSTQSEGEVELDMTDAETSSNGEPALNGLALTNLHGGGRGYVPGQTPDDPKKRHKCDVCGRAFARAFNLKSHVQTHNPLRSKPHQCPHASCKRGFSRLHDLERHRQGIHGDGPLMDAKRTGLAPAAARAQGRMQSRADTDGLI